MFDTFKTLSIERIEELLSSKVLKRDLSEILVYVLIALYTVVFSYFTVLKHHAFRTYGWDLGIFDQALWTTVHNGKLFYYTLELFINPSGSFFGIHFSPMLFLVLPIYALNPTPETLLIFQSLVLALGAVPVYLMAKEKLRNKLLSLIFAVSYLSYPPLHGINWFDFHIQVFLPVTLLFSIYYFVTAKWTRYFAFIFMALMSEDHASLIVIFMGVWGIWLHRESLKKIFMQRDFTDKRVLIPISSIVAAAVWLYITILVHALVFPINPAFYQEFQALAAWNVLGIKSDPYLIPLYVVLNPVKAVQALGFEIYFKLLYILLLFGPLALLPVFNIGPLTATVPWFVQSFFSNYLPFYTIGNQYPSYIIAFIFAAAIYGARKKLLHSVSATSGAIKKRNLLAFLLCIIIAFSLSSPLSPLMSKIAPDYGVPQVTEHELLLQDVVNIIPSNSSILTQNNLFPHFSNRLNAYAIPPIPIIWTRIKSQLIEYVNKTMDATDYVLVDGKTDSSATSLIQTLMQNRTDFGLFVSTQEIFLYRKHYSGIPVVLQVQTDSLLTKDSF